MKNLLLSLGILSLWWIVVTTLPGLLLGLVGQITYVVFCQAVIIAPVALVALVLSTIATWVFVCAGEHKTALVFSTPLLPLLALAGVTTLLVITPLLCFTILVQKDP